MTSKELCYVEDALGHECFMKKRCVATSNLLNDKIRLYDEI